MAKKLSPLRQRVNDLETDLSIANDEIDRLKIENETLHHNEIAARAAEKQAVYRATRMTRRIMHARAVIHSLLEILDSADHPEG